MGCLVIHICELLNVVELTYMRWTFVIVTLLSKLPTYAPIWGTLKSYVLFRILMFQLVSILIYCGYKSLFKAMIV